jgi:hypothetical protein
MRSVTFVRFIAMLMCVSFYGVAIAADTGSPPTKEEVKKEALEAYKKAEAYAGVKKDEYIKKMHEGIADLSEKIEKLKVKAKGAQGEAAIKMNKAIAELKVKQEAAKKKLGELGKDTSSAWSAMKSGLDKAMGELKKAYDDAAQKYK